MEVRKVHGGRDLTGQDVVVDAVGGRPWRYWYAGERVAGPAEGPRAGALYVVKKKEDELQLLERVLAAGEGWSVLLDDEGLGAYREARVEVQPGGAFSGMRTPRTTNGAPPHRIAAFFSRGRRLVGGGCALSLFTGVDPNQQGDIGRGLLDAVPVQALEGRIEVVREAGGNHPDSKVLRTQLVQWLKENEMRLVPRDGSLRDKEVEALCRGCCGLLAVLEDTTVAAAATPGEELFFNVYAAQAVAKLGLAVVLAGGPSEELKAACGGLAEKLKGKAALGMVFYELDWLETGLAMTSAEFDAQKESVDLLTSCVTSIATAAPGPVLSQVLALGVKAFEVKASVDEHNRYFGIAAVERLSLSIRTWLVGTYSGASPSLQKTAVEELKRKLFDLQQQQHHQGARRGASDWRVAFAWIKLMVEVLTFRPILVGDDTIQRLVNDDSTGRLAEAGVTLERLKAHGWVTEHTFSKQDGNFTRCVLCESFPGLWKGGGPGNPTEYVKAKLRSLPKLSVPPELEEMLVAEETLDSPATDTEEEGKAEQEQEQEQEGEEQEEQEEAVFHGLAFFAKIGMSTAEGLLQVVEKASGWMQDKRAKVEVSSTDEKTAKELYSHALTGAMDFALMFMDNEMNLWRVRDRAVVACFEAREAVAGPMNKEELEAALTACKVYETDGRVRKTLESPDLYRGMAGFLKDSWETKAEGILGGIKATMDSLEKQQQVLLHCDPKKRGAAEAVFKKVHADLGFFVRSLSGMQQMLEVSLEFLMDIQYRQLAMEQDLKEVKDGMEKLATFLDANATMEEVCIEQKKEVLSARKVASNDLYIKLYGDVVDDEARLQQDGDTTLMEHARNMLADKDKNTLLVTGKSGSGKSTFMKKLHAHLWESYWGSIDNNDIAQNRDEDEHASPVFTPGEKKAASWNGTMSANNKEYDPNQEEGSLSNTDSDDRCDQVKHHAPVCKKCHTIPVYVSLPKLKDPSTGLVEEAFAGWGIRSANRLRKLQRDCRKGIYRLIFLLDSYDEMGSDFQYTNLYQSNNLRKWGTEWLCEGGKKDAEGIYPKVIISSRCEFLESHSNYRSFFYPTLEYTSGRSSVLTEVRIRDFSTRTCEYLNKDYVLKVEKLGAEYNVGRREVKEILDAAMASGEDVPGQQRLLGRGCFRKQPLSSDTSYAVRRFADELYHIWSPSRLFHAADTSVSELKSTPFMLSILVKVIPTMFSEQNDEAYMEEMFLRTLPEDIGKQLVDRAKYYEFSEANLGKIIDCFDQAKQATLKQTVKHALQISTRSKAMLKYDTYHTFVDQLFENSLPKIRKRNSSVAEEDLKSDLLNYSKTLARQMTLNGKARVHYANTGKAFRKKTVWEEHFSSDSTLLKDIRDGAPLSTEKAGLGGRYYAFIHKSIQV